MSIDKWILVRYDAALKVKLDSLETAGGSISDSETLKISEKSPSIDKCIKPAATVAVKNPKITVKLPTNLAKDGKILLKIMKNFPQISISKNGRLMLVNGTKLGTVASVIKKLYAKKGSNPKNGILEILKILQAGKLVQTQFKGFKNLRVWNKIRQLTDEKQK